MENSKKIKLLLYRHFRMMYKIELTEAQLDDISDFYHASLKEMIKKVGYYRFINFALGMVFLIVFILIYGLFSIGSLIWFIFTAYNFLHSIGNYIQYKKIKEPKRTSDE